MPADEKIDALRGADGRDNGSSPAACADAAALRGRRIREAGICILAFALPVAALLLAFAALRYYPFGDSTIITSDLKFQYLDLLGWLRDVLHGNGSLFYSFSKSLGGNMSATYSYYLASPINLLLVFWGDGDLVGFATFSIVVRAGIAGLASCFFVRRRFELSAPASLALSLGYALCLYFTTEATNLMWLDAVALMPFVMYGIWRIVWGHSPAPFYFWLLVAILSCWYTGYMLCAFSILFYLLECVLAVPEGQKMPRRFLKHFSRFISFYALAVASAAIVLVPMVFAIYSGKGGSLSGEVLRSLRFPIMNGFYGFLLGVVERNFTPQFYCGTLALVSLLALILTNAVPRREKAAIIGLAAFLFVCSYFAVLDIAWTGFRAGVGYYCRWAFIMAFVVVFAAGRFLQALQQQGSVQVDASHKPDTPRRRRGFSPSASMLVSACAIAAFTALVSWRFPSYLGHSYAAAGIALCAAYACLLAWGMHRSKALAVRVAGVLLVACAFGEATLSSYDVFGYIDWEKDATQLLSYSRYSDYYAEGMAQTSAIQAVDSGWHRFDKTYTLVSAAHDAMAQNEGFTYRYMPISSYLSTNDSRVSSFLTSMGYSQQSRYSVSFQDANIVADSILGLKYVSSDAQPAGYESTDIAAQQGSGFTSIAETNSIYENPYALPLGFGASYYVLDGGAFTSDIFDNQERVLSELVGYETDVYTTVSARQLPSDAGTWSWQVEVPAGQDVYCYIGPECSIDGALYIDGVYTDLYCYRFSQGVFELKAGSQARTATITFKSFGQKDFSKLAKVRVRPIYEQHSFVDTNDLKLSAYALDASALQSAIDQLKGNAFDVEEFSDGYVRGSYTSNGEGLLFTSIPYDSGWSVYVNGEKVRPLVAARTFIAIDVPDGTSTIELRYTPPGLIVGAAASAISIAFAAMLLLAGKRRRRKAAQQPQSA